MAGNEQPEHAVDDPRIYFAAERTLLAWVRTGLAMMGFGFVVARFGLFLRELASVRGSSTPPAGLSLWIGVSLVLFGVVVNIGAALKHWRTIERLQRGQPLRFSPLSFGLWVASLLALLGAITATYLVFGAR